MFGALVIGFVLRGPFFDDRFGVFAITLAYFLRGVDAMSGVAVFVVF
jgi:hypothetical protein